MDGIERIAARIREDAEQEIARMNQEATEQVEAIQAQAQAQASREREEILARGRRAADERLERLKSAALMQRRTLELGARQEVLAEAFEKALDQLCSLPDEKMVSLAGTAGSAGRARAAYFLPAGPRPNWRGSGGKGQRGACRARCWCLGPGAGNPAPSGRVHPCRRAGRGKLLI